MAKQARKYSITEIRMAIEEAGASQAAIARILGCTRGTVYSYLKRYPELKERFEAMKGKPIADSPQYAKEAFETAIKGSRGIKTAIVARVGCSKQTLENAIQRWPELGVMIDDERASIVDLAESKLLQQVNNNEIRAILFTLETLGKDRGWSKRTEVTGKDGAALLDIPADLVKQIQSSGLDLVAVLREFVAMPPPQP